MTVNILATLNGIIAKATLGLVKHNSVTGRIKLPMPLRTRNLLRNEKFPTTKRDKKKKLTPTRIAKITALI